MRRLSGAAPAGWFLVAEGTVAAIAAVAFGVIALQHMAGYSGDDGVAALVIAIGFLIAIMLAVYAPLAVLVGRAVKRGDHGAWLGALVLSAAQLVVGLVAWPAVSPLTVLGLVALVLLLLPETRAQCARPPELEEAEPADVPVS